MSKVVFETSASLQDRHGERIKIEPADVDGFVYVTFGIGDRMLSPADLRALASVAETIILATEDDWPEVDCGG